MLPPSTATYISTLTAPSTTDWRAWWATETKANGSDWQGLIGLHLAIVDRLRASSSWAWSS